MMLCARCLDRVAPAERKPVLGGYRDSAIEPAGPTLEERVEAEERRVLMNVAIVFLAAAVALTVAILV